MTASDVRTVTVRLPEPLHRAVKVRCAEQGDSLEGVARAAFVAYLERDDDEPGSVLERAGVRPAGLTAGDTGRDDMAASRQPAAAAPPASRPAPAVSPERAFRPDPKGGSK